MSTSPAPLEAVRRRLGEQTVQLNVAYRVLATRDTEPFALEHTADLLQESAAALLETAETLRQLAFAPRAAGCLRFDASCGESRVWDAVTTQAQCSPVLGVRDPGRVPLRCR
ncbi:hypothetical protein [Streptomyces sp. NPDC020141]|uniref:hypothetical protein n=1 Tax=Streptomyces sp. NPDC020141 TaxID=3365065 RepID=UPI0037A0DBD6